MCKCTEVISVMVSGGDKHIWKVSRMINNR
jgi:hypothetical protein